MISNQSVGDCDFAPYLESVAQPVDVQWENLCYTAAQSKFRFWSKQQKRILDNISGYFEKCKLTAIIGQSGCGKTTLMDIICGYRSTGVSGDVYINGRICKTAELSKKSCYVRQNLVLQPLLTVYEAMIFVANIKLGQAVGKQRKESVLRRILERLRLSDCLDTLTKNLSGGEQRRLAIALELISYPTFIVLDEPITGLDTVSARECVKILQDISTEGVTVVCSLHQPSMSLLNRFNNAYIMHTGRCVYQGRVDKIVAFLRSSDIECPIHYSPVEYILEPGDINGIDIDILVRNMLNGKLRKWMDSLSNQNSTVANINTPHDENEHISCFIYQFICLSTRKMKMLSRDLLLTWLLLISAVVEGVGVGLFFYDKGNDAEWIRFSYNMIFFIVMAGMFNGFFSKIITFPQEVVILQQEYFNRWYSLKAYWLATSITNIPIQNALIFGFFSLAPWILFSGFFFYYRDCPNSLCRWIFDVSILRKALEESLRSTFGYNRGPLNCNSIFCFYKYPDQFLRDMDVEANVNLFWSNAIVLICFYFCFKICAIMVVKLKVT